MKKFLSIILVILTLIGTLSVFTVSASAAKTTAYDVLSSSKYAKVYTLSSSGKTIPYTSKYLTTRGTVTYGRSSSSYIANNTDELYLCDVGVTNGKYWAYVSYPTSSRRVYAYIPLSAISNNNGDHAKKTATGRFYCSYRKTVGTSSSYYVDKGDTVYLLNKDGNQYQIMYPIGGNKWRIGFCSKSNYDKYVGGTQKTTSSASFSPVWPCKSTYKISCLYYYKNGAQHSTRYGYKTAMDIAGSGDVVAIEAGTVITVKNLGSKSFGKYVEIKHANGKVSLYAHLKSYNVSVGDKVSKGQKIGVMGNTGNSSGTHLHFELSGSDPYMDYYRNKYMSKISFEKNVYSNNNSFNSDKRICNIIKSSYRLSGSWYYAK